VRITARGAAVGGASRRQLRWRLAARLEDSGGGGRVVPSRGDEEETSVEARTSDDEDRKQN
jgi:Arc/MetJ family transcription regulator